MTLLLTSVLLNAIAATALAIAVWGVEWIPAIRRRPGLRHALWVVVLLKLVTPPLVELSILPAGLFVAPAPTRHPPAIPLDGFSPAPSMQSRDLSLELDSATTASAPVDWLLVMAAVCGLGTLAVLVVAVWQMGMLRFALRRSASRNDRLNGIARQAAAQMGVAAIPTITIVEANLSPLLWVRRCGPLIVIPGRLAAQLNDQQLGCIVSHEIAHYLRRDHWTNLLSLIVAAGCWWNPVVWWVRRELRTAQEACCDALVISRSVASRKIYAETLFQALEFLHAEPSLLPALASGFGGKSSTERRFEMIANPRVNHCLSWWSYPVLLAALAVLPCLPSFTQAQEVEDLVDVYSSEVILNRVAFELVDGHPTDARVVFVDVAATPGQTDKRAYKAQRSQHGVVVLAFDLGSGKLAWSSEIELPRRDGPVAGQTFLLHTGGGLVTLAMVADDKSLRIQELDAETGKVTGECHLLSAVRNRFSDAERRALEQELKAAQEQLEKLRHRVKKLEGVEEDNEGAQQQVKELSNHLKGLLDEQLMRVRVQDFDSDGAKFWRFDSNSEVTSEDDNHWRVRVRTRKEPDMVVDTAKRVGSDLVIELGAISDGHLTVEMAGTVWRLINGNAPIDAIRMTREGGRDRMVIEGKAVKHARVILELHIDGDNPSRKDGHEAGTPAEGAAARSSAAESLVENAFQYFSGRSRGKSVQAFDYSWEANPSEMPPTER
jgi:beta-lactamase regulating signal transducer with metallopeptidase domain